MRLNRFRLNHLAALILAAGTGIYFAAAQRLTNPAPQTRGVQTQTATFAGGCFWSLENAFRKLPGVIDTVVGYTGGTIGKPTYETVSSHRVDHLEACRVTFDPTQISYEALVEYFFKIHDPTAPNRNDLYLGSPSRLVVFFHNTEQETVATAVKEQLPKPDKSRRAATAEIRPESEFYRAEEYHQRYLERHGLATCRIQP